MGEFQVTIPELGTIQPKRPYVILTSNRIRANYPMHSGGAVSIYGKITPVLTKRSLF
ncbi:MAG: hypothetical protein R2865_11180 [Deinococcales bacterium]